MADQLRDLRLLALRAVLKPEADPEYNLRRIFRWYSRNYNTPLHLVADLPLDDILQHYYEVIYEDLVTESETKNAQLLDNEIAELVETDEERVVRHRREAEEEVDNAEFMARVEEMERRRKAKDQKAERRVIDMDAPLPNSKKELPAASLREPMESPELSPSILAKPEPRSLPAATLPDASTARAVRGADGKVIEPKFKGEENIKLIRMNESDFESWLDRDPVQQPPKKR